MVAALEDSPRARQIARQAFLPAFPIQGAVQSANYIPYSTGSGAGLTDSVIYQNPTTNNIGIGTTSPAGKLDVRVNDASNVGLSIENDDSNTVPTQIRISGLSDLNQQLLIGYNTTNNYASIQSVLQGTAYKPLALQPNGSGVVIGGTTTKQSTGGGGPEKLSFQDTSATKVSVANFVGSETYARLLIDMQGNHEWAGPSDVDQNVLLGWLNLGRLQCQGMGEGGFSLHAWKHSRLTSQIDASQTSIVVDDGSQLPSTPPNFTVRCENELMTVTSRSGNTLTVATRTNGVTHAQGAFITATGKDEAHSRIELNFDGTYGAEMAFSDGTNAADAWLSRPVANQVLLRGNFATQRADITLGNGNNNDKALGGATFAKVTGPTAAFAVTGFAGGSDGRILLLYNSTLQTMTIKNNNASSSAPNRILTLTGADVALRASNQSFATFIYDGGQSLWILVATN